MDYPGTGEVDRSVVVMYYRTINNQRGKSGS